MTPRAVIVLLALAGLLLALSIHRLQCADVAGPYVAFSGRTMGTTYEVKVAEADLRPDDMRAVGAAIEDTLEHVSALMSTWRDDSEISRFNAQSSRDAFPIHPDTAKVFATALSVSRRSGGAFDVTVSPLVAAWGFGRAAAEQPPSDDDLTALRARVGYEKLTLDSDEQTLSKDDPALETDLSALAKGFGVDAIARTLEDLGHTHYLVEIGGELRARGQRLDGRAFRVAIEEPLLDARRIHRVIELHDIGMATSGDYRNWIEVDGQRLSHTLDPRTGRPIRHGLASVTVLHESAMWADAWATALSVLGPEPGYALAISEDLAAYLIVRRDDGSFETRATPAFAALLEGDDASAAASN